MYEWLSFWEPIKGMEKRFLFWATGSVILVLKWVDMCVGGRQVSPSPTFSLQIPFLVCFRRLMGRGIIHCIMKPFACDVDPSWMGGRVQPLPVSAPPPCSLWSWLARTQEIILILFCFGCKDGKAKAGETRGLTKSVCCLLGYLEGKPHVLLLPVQLMHMPGQHVPSS